MSRMPPILPMLPKTPLPQTSGIDWLRHGETRGGSRFRGRTDDPLTPEGWRQMWTTVAHYHAGARLAPDDESPLHELRPNLHQGFATSRLTNEVAGDFCADSREGPRQVPESEDLRRDWHTDLPLAPGPGDAGLRPWDRIIASPLIRCADFGRALSQRLDLPLSLDPRLVELDFGAWEGRSAADLMASDAEALGRFWADPVTHAPPGGESLPAFQARVLAAWRDLTAQALTNGERLLVISHGGVIRVILCTLLDHPLGRLLELEVGHASLTRVGLDRTAAGTLPTLAASR